MSKVQSITKNIKNIIGKENRLKEERRQFREWCNNNMDIEDFKQLSLEELIEIFELIWMELSSENTKMIRQLIDEKEINKSVRENIKDGK
jgi:hypothetical protein